MRSEKAVLLLEDGAAFEGESLGCPGEAVGEVVLYTGVVGYQEVITNPSYRGTLVVFTYPIIGCYGVNSEDNESSSAQARGAVVKEYSAHVSNFRAQGALEDLLKEQGVVGIRGVDTRAVAVYLREHGEMKGVISSDDSGREALLQRLRSAPSPWDGDLLAGCPPAEAPPRAGQASHRVVALDLGIKRSLLRQFAELGCAVEVLPCSSSPEEVLRRNSEGLILAGGPGDPKVAAHVTATVKALLGKVPVLGIGLGHQILATALGCGIARMKIGHRGVNYPVRNTATRACDITVQHHSFVVDAKGLPDAVEVTHTNVNDGTVEGIRSKRFSASSVQFHPCPDEMGRPNKLLREFLSGASGA